MKKFALACFAVSVILTGCFQVHVTIPAHGEVETEEHERHYDDHHKKDGYKDKDGHHEKEMKVIKKKDADTKATNTKM